MDPKFQPSFIPKKNELVGDSFKRPKGVSGGLFYVLGVSLFVLAVVSSAGVFAYEKYLQNRISGMQEDLEAARQALNPSLVKEISRSNARIVSAKEILSSHISITNLFSFLEEQTLQSLRFSDFSFSSDNAGKASIVMNGEARDYRTVALQSDIFSRSPNLKNVSFTGLDLNDSGNVTFSFKANVVPEFLLYERGFDARSIQTAPVNTALPPDDTQRQNVSGGQNQSDNQGPINPI